MVKSITSKQLRTDFTNVRKQLLKGTEFVVYYRSVPLGKFIPYQEKTEEKKKFSWKDIDKWVGHTKDRKPFSAVELIRKDRGYDD
jgi:hypothetical protein